MMRQYYIQITSIVLFLLACNPLLAQEEMDDSATNTITIDGQIRARGEYRHGYSVPVSNQQKPVGFVNERARLGIGYQSDYVSLKLAGQHVGVWGEQALADKNGNFSLNEAWGQLNTKDRRFLLRIGRQILSYDDERILGANDWNVAGNSHNVALLGFENEQHRIHVFGAFNQNQETENSDYDPTYYDPTETGLYKHMEGIWYHFGKADAPFQFSVLALNVANEVGRHWSEATIYTHLAGAYLTYNSKKFEGSLSGYVELGKDTLNSNIKALMAALNVAYKPMPGLKIQAGADALTGGHSADWNTSHQFNPLFSSYHNFYGNLDYFTSKYFGNVTFGSGLLDIHGGASYRYRNFDASAIYHYFTTTHDYGAKKMQLIALGQEIDINLNYRPVKDCTISAGYSHAILTKNTDYLLGGNHGCTHNYGYISVNFTPRILKYTFNKKTKESTQSADIAEPIEPAPAPKALFKQYE